MKYGNLIITVIIGLTLAVSAYAQTTGYRSQRLSTAQGLSASIINDITYDHRGFIWMATNNGPFRYDGYHFRNFALGKTDQCLKTVPYIAVMLTDRRHNLLWMRNYISNVVCLDLNTGLFVDYTSDGNHNQIFTKWIMARNCDLWLYHSENGVRRIEVGDSGFKTTDFNVKYGTLPSNNVGKIVEDSTGGIWLCTDKGVVYFDGKENSHQRNSSVPTTMEKDRNIIEAAAIGRDRVIMLTDNQEILCYSANGKRIYEQSLSPTKNSFMTGNITSSVVWKGKWYIFTQSGTVCINPKTGAAKPANDCNIPGGRVQESIDNYHFISNDSGQLWIMTPQGELKTLYLIPNVQSFAQLRTRRSHRIARAANGDFLVATYGNGLFILNPKNWKSRHFSSRDKEPLIPTGLLRNVSSDPTGCIWVATEDMRVNCLKPITGININYVMPNDETDGERVNMIHYLGRLNESTLAATTYLGDSFEYDVPNMTLKSRSKVAKNIYDMITDHEGNHWTGTQHGLFLNGKLLTDSTVLTATTFIRSVTEDKHHRVWIGTWGDGLLMMQKEKDGRWHCKRQMMQKAVFESRIRQSCITADGMMWIAAWNGLYCLDVSKPSVSERINVFNDEHGNLPIRQAMSVYAAKNGMLWVGSSEGKILRCHLKDGKMDFEQYTNENAAGVSDIISITEDLHGNIWAGCHDGIMEINPHTHTLTSYQLSANVLQNTCMDRCALTLSDGRIVFGTAQGMAIVSPNKTESIQAGTGKLQITDICVNGISLFENEQTDDYKLLSEVMLHGTLRLSHDRNSLSISFSDMNFAKIESSIYQYYLEGAEKSWGNHTVNNTAYYSNLKPGRYTFHLRTLQNDGTWRSTAMDIIISQPWWNTWWAWTLYLLAVISATYYIYKNAQERLSMRQQIKLEHLQSEFRAKFFTNVAHEFRTPLAIIQGATDKIVASKAEGLPHDSIHSLKRGVSRMTKLVNRFMEYRKINSGNYRLRLQDDDIVGFTRKIHNDFWPLAEQKDIKLIFTSSDKSITLSFDHQAVETIVYNLISNAIKYTPAKGQVMIAVRNQETESKEHMITITVTDNGPGISAVRQKELFKPFMNGFETQGGMGIGLYSAHELAAIHKGSLTYSDAEGGGSIFTLTIPADSSHYPTDFYLSDEHQSQSKLNYYPEETNVNSNFSIKEPLPPAMNSEITIAIIEDDPDLLTMLSKELAQYFTIVTYMNGSDALAGVTSNNTQLVLCDVMLPDINGFEIVKQLKTHKQTAGIPVIMLTALSDDEHQIKGYKAGADDYMIKPCNIQLLLLRITQLIKWHSEANSAIEEKNSGERVTPNIQNDTQKEIITNAADQKLLQRMEIIVGSHINDRDFGVDELAEALHIGRTKLFGKTKELLNITPNNYIINERLNAAKELLDEAELNISEIAYKVGFDSDTYFNKLFKKKFGVTPGQYKKGIRN